MSTVTAGAQGGVTRWSPAGNVDIDNNIIRSRGPGDDLLYTLCFESLSSSLEDNSQH